MMEPRSLDFKISALEFIWNHAKGGCVLWRICYLEFAIFSINEHHILKTRHKLLRKTAR